MNSRLFDRLEAALQKLGPYEVQGGMFFVPSSADPVAVFGDFQHHERFMSHPTLQHYVAIDAPNQSAFVLNRDATKWRYGLVAGQWCCIPIPRLGYSLAMADVLG
jgi:hypothetical protein